MMLELVVVEVWSRVVVVEAALDEVDGCTVTFTVVVPTLDPGQSVFNSWPSKVNPSNDCELTFSPPHMAWTREDSSSKPFIQSVEHWLPFVKSDVEQPTIWVLYANMHGEGIEFEVMIWKLANDKADVVEASASSPAAIRGPLGDLLRDEISHIANSNDFVLGWC
ncbi:hypothetical protein SCAR479_10715 [Seiridium cardinale]|uniref:Uncharacterized protein n=1 Tax=Seiridium cardinale TaxID=138064 RepID=A0ABR2XFV1_9PEZI